MEQEVELLASAPPEELRTGDLKRDGEDNAWRLEGPRDSLFNQSGPLLDASGRVR